MTLQFGRQLPAPKFSCQLALDQISFSGGAWRHDCVRGTLRGREVDAREASGRPLYAPKDGTILLPTEFHSNRVALISCDKNRLCDPGHATLTRVDPGNLSVVNPKATDAECMEVLQQRPRCFPRRPGLIR